MTRWAVISAVVLLLTASPAAGAPEATSVPAGGEVLKVVEKTIGPGGTVKALLLITILAVAPAVAVMVTCFTRIIVVLGLLRHALGTQQLPPNQILFGLALFMTLVVMAPVFRGVHRDAVAPYTSGTLGQAEAWNAGKKHLRGFMIDQVETAGNVEDVYLFIDDELAGREELAWSEVPTESLIPAFVLSELKTAFLIGFRFYLPFVVIDMLVASVLLSMGMIMLPPATVSLPFKLLLFVLADGWHLVVGTLIRSFA